MPRSIWLFPSTACNDLCRWLHQANFAMMNGKKKSFNSLNFLLFFFVLALLYLRGSILYVSVFNFAKWKANLSHFPRRFSHSVIGLSRIWWGCGFRGSSRAKESDQVVAGLMLMLINYTTAFKLKSSADNSNEFNWKTVFRRSSRFAYKSVKTRGGARCNSSSQVNGWVFVPPSLSFHFISYHAMPSNPIQSDSNPDVQGKIAAS